MTQDHWLESATITVASILATDHGVHVDRTLLAATIDRRRSNLMRSLNLPETLAEPLLTAAELRQLAGHIARAHEQAMSAVA